MVLATFGFFTRLAIDNGLQLPTRIQRCQIFRRHLVYFDLFMGKIEKKLVSKSGTFKTGIFLGWKRLGGIYRAASTIDGNSAHASNFEDSLVLGVKARSAGLSTTSLMTRWEIHGRFWSVTGERIGLVDHVLYALHVLHVYIFP